MSELNGFLPTPLALDEIDRLMQSGEYEDALDAAEMLVGRTRTAATLHALGRAQSEFAAATYDEALHDRARDTLREAADRAPDGRARAAILADRATRLTNSVFLSAELEAEAAWDFREAHEADPSNAAALMGLALMRQQPEIAASRAQAIGWVEEAIGQGQMSDREDWAQWSLLAHLLEEDGQDERAASAYEQMLALFPFGTGHPMEFVMRQQRKHLQNLRGERMLLFDPARLIPPRD